MEIKKVFELQQSNRRRLKASTVGERIEKLDRIHRAIESRTEELVQAVREDLRKPEPEIQLSEIYPVVTEIKHARSYLADWMKPASVPSPLVLLGARSEVRYEPKGVVLIIAPWNFPFQLALSPLISAIAAGNAAIVKPSELAPRTAAFTGSLLRELFDPSEVSVIEGDADVARSLTEQPFDHIFFTGSPGVGRKVMAAAARHLTSVTLELGGKSPVIVDTSADLTEAATKIVWGKCLNAGQSCVAPDYALVHEGQQARFIELAREALEDRYGPLERLADNPDYGRIINKDHFRRLETLVDAAVRGGARIEVGGTSLKEDLFIPPTFLTGVRPDSPILQEEIFGPLLPIVSYESREAAVATVAARPKPLALYVFARNRAAAETILGDIDSGDSVVNDVLVHYASPYLPFGGVRSSGMGKAHGFAGFKAFSHERAVMHQTKKGLPRLLYPPYTPLVRRLIRFTLRFF